MPPILFEWHSDPKTLARRKKIEEERKKECTFQPQLYQSSSTQYLKVMIRID